MKLNSIATKVFDGVRRELPAATRREIQLEFESDQHVLNGTLNQITKDILDLLEIRSMITTMVPRVIEESYSSSNGKRLIQIKTTRQVEKLKATEKLGAIISNNLLQSPRLVDTVTENLEKAADKAIESRSRNSPDRERSAQMNRLDS